MNSTKQQERNRALTNKINVAYESNVSTLSGTKVNENVLHKIRELDPLPLGNLPHPTLPDGLLSSSSSSSISPSLDNFPTTSSIYRTLPKNIHPLRTNSGLYFRDILKQPEQSIQISQSIRENGSRFNPTK
jgi:hypothetical protein